jgi:hypothetical protein
VTWAFAALGLAPDADERAIKRAYATRLKTSRPDEDPEGFQRLNEAYQAALAQCRGMATRDAVPIAPIATDISDAIDEAAPPRLRVTPAPASPPAAAYRPFFGRRKMAWDDPEMWIDLSLRTAFHASATDLRQWLLDQPVWWSLAEKSRFRPRLLAVFEARVPPMPRANFDALAEFFGFDRVEAGLDHAGLMALREAMDDAWIEIRDERFRDGIRPSDPPPWSEGAAEHRLARRRRAEQRAEQEKDAAECAERARRGRWIAQVAERDYPHLLAGHAIGWRDLGRLLRPGYPGRLRDVLTELGCDTGDALPDTVSAPQVRFWLAAGDAGAWSWPRAGFLAARTLVALAIFGVLIGLVAGLVDLHPGIGARLALGLCAAFVYARLG